MSEEPKKEEQAVNSKAPDEATVGVPNVNNPDFEISHAGWIVSGKVSNPDHPGWDSYFHKKGKIEGTITEALRNSLKDDGMMSKEIQQPELDPVEKVEVEKRDLLEAIHILTLNSEVPTDDEGGWQYDPKIIGLRDKLEGLLNLG